MEFSNASTIEIALTPSGTELLNRSTHPTRWELEKLTKVERETNQRSEPTITLLLKTPGPSLRVELTEALCTPSTKRQPMVWK